MYRFSNINLSKHLQCVWCNMYSSITIPFITGHWTVIGWYPIYKSVLLLDALINTNVLPHNAYALKRKSLKLSKKAIGIFNSLYNVLNRFSHSWSSMLLPILYISQKCVAIVWGILYIICFLSEVNNIEFCRC